MSLFNPSGGGGFMGAVNPFSDDFGSFAKAKPFAGLNPFGSGGTFSNFGDMFSNPGKQWGGMADFASGLPDTLSKFNPLKPWDTVSKLGASDPTGLTAGLASPIGTGVGGVPLFSGGEPGSPVNNMVQALQGVGMPGAIPTSQAAQAAVAGGADPIQSTPAPTPAPTAPIAPTLPPPTPAVNPQIQSALNESPFGRILSQNPDWARLFSGMR